MNRTCLMMTLVLGLLCGDFLAAENWPGWRGPRGDGTSIEKGVPTEWDGASGKNIRWKVPIPGKGHASPIIWKDRIFVVSCLPDEKSFLRNLCSYRFLLFNFNSELVYSTVTGIIVSSRT